MGRIVVTCAASIISLLTLTGAAIIQSFPQNETYSYDKTEEVFNNPLMGYAPSADYPSRYPDSSLVYIDITWREWEPEEGVFNFIAIQQENFLEQWREQGKHAVLRFVCDVPSDNEHRDIPDWLYEKTAGDGVAYDMSYGKGYSPNYSNATFISCHSKAIKALGEYFGNDGFVCYIELGSLGHWGEWHVNSEEGAGSMPGINVRRQYVEPYVESFQNARILMRRPFAEGLDSFGVFNDMAGHASSTNTWLDWIKQGGVYDQTGEKNGLIARKRIWETAPVGGEFTSSIPMETMLGSDLSKTSRLIARSHMTFLGPKIPSLQEDGTLMEGADEILLQMGYRYRVSNLTMQESWLGQKTALRLTWTNDGVAPIYWKWIPCVYLLRNDIIIQRIPLNIDLTALTQGTSVNKKVSVSTKLLKEEDIKIGVGIENPETGEPSVFLPMEGERIDSISILWKPGK